LFLNKSLGMLVLKSAECVSFCASFHAWALEWEKISPIRPCPVKEQTSQHENNQANQ
jgi:hypothetical protein